MCTFLINKYHTWYFQIITNAQNRSLDGYFERHHIIPRSLGGLDDSSNIVALTAKEHFICHKLLIKMTQGVNKSKMVLAIKMMLSFSKTHKLQRYTKMTARSFEIIRSLVANATSELKKGVPLSDQARANIKASRTPEVRAKISAAQKGRAFPGDKQKLSASVSASMTPEHRALLSQKAKERPPISDETRAKMRASKKPMSQETIDKLTIMNKERILSDEAKAKLSVANKGVKRKLTSEQIAKRTESQRLAREARLLNVIDDSVLHLGKCEL